MKKGLKVLVSLAYLFSIGLPIFAQPNSKGIETIVLDNFDNVGEQNYLYKGEDLSWEWAVTASRYIDKEHGYPKMGYFEGIPNSLKQFQRGTGEEHKVLGVKTVFNRKGDNWFEIYPTKDDKLYEVPFVGDVSHIDFWVWGANYNYTLDLLIRDANGIVHVLRAGNLAFHGWRNMVVKIPGGMCQQSARRTGRDNIYFLGFRIRSNSEEFVDDFVVYFDQVKYTTNPLDYIYDGFELNNVDFGDDTAASNQESGDENSADSDSGENGEENVGVADDAGEDIE